MNKEELIKKIKGSFQDIKYPGDWCLRGSNEGEEPYLLEKEFKGRDDWTNLSSKFLDQAPDGFSSALSFFSDEAFRFYLPAYIIADLNNKLEETDVLFHLCHCFTDLNKNSQINPQRYGEKTWFDTGSYKFSVFNKEQARLIIEYLKFKKKNGDLLDSEKKEIEEALNSYWNNRLIMNERADR